MKMCLKANVVGNNDILSKKINKQCDEIIKILEEGKLQENFESYELVVDLHSILSSNPHIIFFNKNSLFQIFLSYFQIIFLIFAN